MATRDFLREFDWLVFGSACALMAIGFFFVWSASSQTYAFRQLIFMGIGFGLFFGLLALDYMQIVRQAYILYVVFIVALIAVLFLGSTIRGTHRWFDLGMVNFQPSEFMKIILVLALARYLMYKEKYKRFSILIISLAFTLLPMALIFMQPDLGSGLILLPIFFAMVFITGARIKHFSLLIPAGLAALPLGWFFLLHEYQKARIIGFIWPSETQDWGAAYHRLQSLVAIGSGGVLGQGWKQGVQTQLNILPEPHTDFIFSVIAEEWGFLRTFGVMIIFLVFIIAILGIAYRTRDPVGRLVLIGFVAMFSTQIFINIAMALGVAPITGLNLPFVSYGGSSLVSSLLALSLIINVGIRNRVVLTREDFT
ncbi:MAG: rod shape-determining protein RodA [Candidatus Brocadiales bacterium]